MNQIKTLDEVNKTCAAIPDLIAKVQEDADRSSQILQLLTLFPNYDADMDKVSKEIGLIERSAKGIMMFLFSD